MDIRFPQLSDAERLARLEPPAGSVRAVIDTDPGNEIDDQFALTYALLSPERLSVEAIYAAPFHNQRSQGPEGGMLRSYAEIGRVLGYLGRSDQVPVYQGARSWLSDATPPASNPAAEDLMARARAGRQNPLYVVALAAITNVATALLLDPEIACRIVVVWLAGNAGYWPSAAEFNLSQDVAAARVVLDSGVPLVHVPCIPVADHLITTQAELRRYVKGRGKIGDYLYQIYSAAYRDHLGRSWVLWDLGPVAWLVEPAWVPTALTPSPLLTDTETWAHDPGRHLIREARSVNRDEIFGDLFRKLALSGGAAP